MCIVQYCCTRVHCAGTQCTRWDRCSPSPTVWASPRLASSYTRSSSSCTMPGSRIRYSSGTRVIKLMYQAGVKNPIFFRYKGHQARVPGRSQESDILQVQGSSSSCTMLGSRIRYSSGTRVIKLVYQAGVKNPIFFRYKGHQGRVPGRGQESDILQVQGSCTGAYSNLKGKSCNKNV